MVQFLNQLKSRLTIFTHDALMIFIAWWLAYFFRFNLTLSDIHGDQWAMALYVLPLVFFIQVFFYWQFKLYRGVWRFASLPDLVRIIKAVLMTALTTNICLFFIARLNHIPRSIFPLYAILLVGLLGGNRMIYRLLKDGRRKKRRHNATRVLVLGAGLAGEGLVRDMLRHYAQYVPVAFVDDDPKKLYKDIQGVRVIGHIDKLSALVKTHRIDLLMIAIPSATSAQMRNIMEFCRAAKVSFQTLPGLSDFTDGRVSIGKLREVSLEDLLGREEINIDLKAIAREIKGKVILVTGGGGSIGTELCHHIARFHPESLVVIEKTELNLHELRQSLEQAFPSLVFKGYLTDICDRLMVEKIMRLHQPMIVFHAAAYKHVPLLEDQAYAAFKNNVFGTRVMAEESIVAHVDKFILISSDKAVNPANVMGATKRAAELLCHSLNHPVATKFITVRFGNVLGSSGSVVPRFKKQLERGDSLTVTHPEITRFFMTIPEAVQLILQASTQGKGGELFVLDMGEPIKIQQLAEQMIALAGKELGRDVDIIHTGLRPGEKLYEELFYDNEERIKTTHQKICLASNAAVLDTRYLTRIFQAYDAFDHESIMELLQEVMIESTAKKEFDLNL